MKTKKWKKIVRENNFGFGGKCFQLKKKYLPPPPFLWALFCTKTVQEEQVQQEGEEGSGEENMRHYGSDGRGGVELVTAVAKSVAGVSSSSKTGEKAPLFAGNTSGSAAASAPRRTFEGFRTLYTNDAQRNEVRTGGAK